MRFASQGATSESVMAAMMAGSIQRWCKCAMTMTPSTVPMTSGTDQRRFPSQSISFRFVMVDPMPRKKEPDLEVPDDGTVGDAREKELQKRDGNEESTAYDDGEDADNETAHEQQRRLACKQPGRERANPRKIHHGTSP